MEYLNLNEIQAVSGGAGFSLTLAVEVPEAAASDVSTLLIGLLTGQISDPTSFANAILASDANLAEVTIQQIQLGKFV